MSYDTPGGARMSVTTGNRAGMTAYTAAQLRTIAEARAAVLARAARNVLTIPAMREVSAYPFGNFANAVYDCIRAEFHMLEIARRFACGRSSS